MEYDYDRNHIGNKLYSSSPTSSSSSSTSTSSILPTLMNRQKMSSNQQQKTTSSQFATMSSSTSQIFATAASFNICQNDTVYYSRETIHLLVRFLSLNSSNSIFRSLYSFAPDNLTWLWTFIDWDRPLDMKTISVQDKYEPFKPVGNLTIDETELHEVNKLFLDAPLIQYKYREPIMIGDVYKFLEHISKIEQTVVAKSLFLLYFPRFSAYVDDPLKNIIRVQILKTNINLIKRVDEIIISLVKSRYPGIDEYKENISRGINLPSYIRSLLKENNVHAHELNYLTNEIKAKSASSTEKQHELKTQLKLKLKNGKITETSPALYSPFSIETNVEQKLNNDMIEEEMISCIDLNKDSFNNPNKTDGEQSSQSPSIFFPSGTKTIDYMKLLEESNRINGDLDHVSFDKQKALFCNKIAQENLDVFYENGSSDNMFINNMQLKLNGTYDENNNTYDCVNYSNDVDDDLSGYQDSNLAAHILASEQANMELNLATLTLPQLNNLTDTLSNANSSALASPRQDVMASNQKQCLNSSKLSYTKLPLNCLNTSSCISPSSPKYNSNIFHTPKTPSCLGQYNDKQITDYSVWSNGASQNPSKLSLSNTNRFFNANSVTPPPSATFKTSPLSVVTNNGVLDVSNSSCPTGSKINSPNYSELLSPNTFFNKNQFNNKLNESLNLNTSAIPEDLNAFLKHQFYGSPVARNNKFNDYRSNSNRIMQKSDFDRYSNLKTTRFNSNTDLNTNSNLFFQRNDLLEDLNSPSKSTSSTSSGNHAANYTNPNHKVNTSSHQHQHTWSGRLPPKIYSENSIYSRKVFLGGLPWDVNQQYLVQLLQKYGSVKLEIPGKDQKHPRVSNINKSQERSTPGYVYIIYEHESAVQRMLADCRKEIKNGGEHYYYTIFIPPTNNSNSSNNFYYGNSMVNKRGKAKEVEVIPWNQEDTSYVPQNKTSMLPAKIDAKTTVFVGALHGMLNAQGLAKVMNEVFGEVIHAGLDTDKYKYPIGSGRVTFRNRQSYVKAIKSKFVAIKANLEQTDPSPKFEKTIQIDPYLEDAKCFKCNNRSLYFCRNEFCLDYYCENCWKTNHDIVGNGEHQSLSRQNKSEQMNKLFK